MDSVKEYVLKADRLPVGAGIVIIDDAGKKYKGP